jgi:hypothetical protein
LFQTSSSRFVVRVAQAAAVLALVAGAVGTAVASNPEDTFAGQIITATKSIPTTAKSKSAYISTLKKMKTSRFWEDKETKEYKIYYTAFFRKPLNDLEVTVKLYDISGGGQHLVNSFEQYVDKRGTRSFTSYIKLEHDDFGVNKQLLMTMENHGTVLSMTKFAILGEGEHYTGQVNFSEDEAKNGSKE